MVKPIELEKSRVDKEPYLVWNAFINLIGVASDELSEIQTVAHLAFWYDSQVQNGGHLQYFENTFIRYPGKEHIIISASLEALQILGAKEQAKILTQASRRYLSHMRKHPSTVEEYVELSLEGKYGVFDRRYYHCSPSIMDYLEKYLEAHQAEFVTVI